MKVGDRVQERARTFNVGNVIRIDVHPVAEVVTDVRRDDDGVTSYFQYVYWSEIVDAPHCGGPKEYVQNYIRTRLRENADEERFDRADKTGSSDKDPKYPAHTWESRTFIAEQRGLVKREDLPEMVRCMSDGKPYPHILMPLDDEEE